MRPASDRWVTAGDAMTTIRMPVDGADFRVSGPHRVARWGRRRWAAALIFPWTERIGGLYAPSWSTCEGEGLHDSVTVRGRTEQECLDKIEIAKGEWQLRHPTVSLPARFDMDE